MEAMALQLAGSGPDRLLSAMLLQAKAFQSAAIHITRLPFRVSGMPVTPSAGVSVAVESLACLTA